MVDADGHDRRRARAGRQRHAPASRSTSTTRASGPSSSTRRSGSGCRRSTTPTCSPPAVRRSTTGRSSSSASRRATSAPRPSRCSPPTTAVAEIERVADLGFHAAYFSGRRHRPAEDWNARDRGSRCGRRSTRPGSCAASTSAPNRTTPAARTARTSAGPGGALLNYVETTYGGQRAVSKVIASGVFDRHPALQGDRVRRRCHLGPVRRRPPRRGVPAARVRGAAARSNDCRASTSTSTCTRRSSTTARPPPRYWAMGWQNVCWGSDYPHLEGTFGHTQKTLHELFDDVDAETRQRISVGSVRRAASRTSRRADERPERFAVNPGSESSLCTDNRNRLWLRNGPALQGSASSAQVALVLARNLTLD